MMETLIKKQSIKSQMLRWSFLSLVSIGIFTSCNKEEIKKQENVLTASVEQQQPTKFKVHFEGEVYTLYVKDFKNFDYTYKELNNSRINELAAKNSLHTVPGFPDENGRISSNLFVYGEENQAESKIELMLNTEMSKQIYYVGYRCYQLTNYTGNSATIWIDNEASSVGYTIEIPDLRPTYPNSRVYSYKYITGNLNAVRGVYFFTDTYLTGKVFRTGVPNISNAITLGLQNKRFIAGSDKAQGYWYW